MLDKKKLEVKINHKDNILAILKKVKKVADDSGKDLLYEEMVTKLESVQSPFFLEIIKEYFIISIQGEDNTVTRTAPEGTCSQCGCTANDCSQCIDAQGFACSLGKTGICSRCARENYLTKCPQCDSTVIWIGTGKGKHPVVNHQPDCPIIVKASFEL